MSPDLFGDPGRYSPEGFVVGHGRGRVGMTQDSLGSGQAVSISDLGRPGVTQLVRMPWRHAGSASRSCDRLPIGINGLMPGEDTVSAGLQMTLDDFLGPGPWALWRSPG